MKLADKFFDSVARSVIGLVCRSPALAERMVEALAPQLAQRLATTPVLFGGEWSRVRLGAGVNLVNTLINVSSGTVEIGDHSFFGHNVSLLTGTHHLERRLAERQGWPDSGRDIVIGKGVWIASNAVINGPCVIGDHAVVAAGAVVVGGRLDPGCLYAGVPARKVREIGAG